jgi:hypothetical protein
LASKLSKLKTSKNINQRIIFNDIVAITERLIIAPSRVGGIRDYSNVNDLRRFCIAPTSPFASCQAHIE